MFSLSWRSPNAYTNLSFCTWYIIVNTVLGYEINASCIKAIKSTYSAYRESKTVCKKRMNKYLEDEKEAGAYEATEHVVRIVKEHFVKKSHQATTKHAHPSPSASDLSRKKARKEPKAEVPLQGASQPGLGSAESEKDEEVAPLRIQSWCGRGPAVPERVKVAVGT